MKDRWLLFISPILLLAVWELLVQAGVLDRRFFPPPSEIFARTIQLIQDGTLVQATLTTLTRMGIGFAFAAVPGVFLGVAMGVSRPTRLLFSPLIAAIYPIPKIALVPMVVILLGIGEHAKYAVVFISVFFLVALGTLAGVMNLDQKYFDIARNNGASKWDILWTVALPGTLPSILSAINLGIGFALTVIVGTEMLLPDKGLGQVIWSSYQVYDISAVFAALIVVAVLGWALNLLMNEIERQVVPWRADSSSAKTLERSSAKEPRIRRFVRTWWMAMRPFSFTASVTPVVLGAVVAAYDGFFNIWLFALTLLGTVSIHAGTNLINDYYDWKKGADTPDSLGPNRAMQTGLLTVRQVLIGGLLCFAFGSAIGLFLVATRGPFILLLGVLSVLAGWFYTAGPKAFAYIGLGEVVVFLFMGPIIVIGSYYVMALQVTWQVFLLSLPIGFLVAAILHANNMRDLDGDLAKNKRTLANIFGRAASRYEYLFLVGGGFAMLGLLVLTRQAPLLALLPLVVLPSAVRLIQRAFASDEPAMLNRVLRGTAKLHERFGWLMIGGIVMAMAVR